MKQLNLFELLTGGVEVLIRNANPWWRGESISAVPSFRRWPFVPVLDSLRNGMTPATVLRGPRQIGKTTLLEQIVQELLADGIPPSRILRLQFDDLPELKRLSMPLIELVDWYAKNILHKTLNEASKRGFSTVRVICGDLEMPRGSKLPDSSCDVVLISNLLFQVDDKSSVLREAARIVRPDGRLAIIDWEESFGGMGPIKDAVCTKDAALLLAHNAGFTLRKEFSAGAHHYGLIFEPSSV